jgi:hypothetical protein
LQATPSSRLAERHALLLVLHDEPASSASAKGCDRSCIAKPVERIGNDVCPVMAKVLVEADYVPDYVPAMSRN